MVIIIAPNCGRENTVGFPNNFIFCGRTGRLPDSPWIKMTVLTNSGQWHVSRASICHRLQAGHQDSLLDGLLHADDPIEEVEAQDRDGEDTGLKKSRITRFQNHHLKNRNYKMSKK